MNLYKSLSKIGTGEVCPQWKSMFLALCIILASFHQAQAQIDIEIVIIMGLSPYAGEGELIEITPNPFTTDVNLTYDDDEVELVELVIKDVEGTTLYSLDLESGTCFTVQLTPGTYYFLVETDSVVITKQAVMSGG